MFIFGGVLFSAVSVYAVTYFPSNQVTYDNSSSKLSSTNVQGAIDELYNTCSKVASSGKYLYFGTNRYYGTSNNVNYGFVYRCNLDGSSCSVIYSQYEVGITGVYATSENLYFGANSYYSTSNNVNFGHVYRCNLDGSSCSAIYSQHEVGITGVYVTSENLYFGANDYYSGGDIVNFGHVYRCNLDGSSCSAIYSEYEFDTVF